MANDLAMECATCMEVWRCGSQRAQHAQAVARAFAWEQPRPDCQQYRPRHHHGIEGVLASPHPTRSRAAQ